LKFEEILTIIVALINQFSTEIIDGTHSSIDIEEPG